MKYTSLKQKAKATNERRELLIGSLRTHLLPVFLKEGFEVAPLPGRGPIDRELVLSLPLGRLRRLRGAGIDLIEVDFAKYRRAAFRIAAGIAPKEGMMTYTGHWPAEDVFVGWLNEFFMMYASPHWRRWFSVWHRPHRSPTQSDYDKLAEQVVGYVPELELALREGRLGPHVQRIVIPRPVPQVAQTFRSAGFRKYRDTVHGA